MNIPVINIRGNKYTIKDACARTALESHDNIMQSEFAVDKAVLDLEFVNGTVANATDPLVITPSNSIVCTPAILCVPGFDSIEFVCNSGWVVDLWVFSGKNPSSRTKYTNWSGSFKYLLAQKYILILGKRSDNANITPDDFKANVTIYADRHSIQQDLDNASFMQTIKNYSRNDLVYEGTILDNGAYNFGNGYCTTLFRAIPGDKIDFTIRTEASRKAFVVFNKTGTITYSVNGEGTTTNLQHSYTFTSSDYWFAFVSYISEAALSAFTAVYKSNRGIETYQEIPGIVDDHQEQINAILTAKDFEGDFYIGALNGTTKNWVASTTGIVQRRDFPIRLSAGDIIYLSDSTGVHFRAMYLEDGTNSRSITNWYTTQRYTVTAPGIYWIEIETTPAEDVTDIYDYTSLLRVVKHSDIYDTIKQYGVMNQKRDWYVKSINHRGMNLIAPENTMPAFLLSAKMGWSYIETDIAKTSDGVIVLLHDETINRTARNMDGTEIEEEIRISDITYQEALQYDFGIWKGDEYAGTQIPRLDEFLSFCRKASIHPYLDLGSITDTSTVNSVVSLVKRNGMEKNTTIIAIQKAPLLVVKQASSLIRLGLITQPTSAAIENAQELKGSGNDVFIDAQVGTYETEEIINSLISAGIALETYTPNYASDIVQIDDYVTGVTSDFLVAGKVLFEDSI